MNIQIAKKFLKIIGQIISSIFIFLLFIFLVFNWPIINRNEQMKIGVAFSPVFSRSLGLNWRENYLAILEDLRVNKIRLVAYWTEIEKEKGVYDFSDLDWQLNEARKRGVEVILAFGIKVPRWPECFIPEFYKQNKQEREIAILKMEKELIARYRDYKNIKIWQVENEPFLPFGNCVEGAVDGKLVDKEITQTKSLDPTRPIMVTDSGELSLWIAAAKRSDIFGTTLYRVIHKKPLGYFTYPLGPAFFKIKASLVHLLAGEKKIIISELQAEPWGPTWITEMPIEEQYKSMNPQKLEDIIIYAQKTGFSEAYLWGAEWWYWLKIKQNHPEMWDTAQKIFSQDKIAPITSSP